MIKTYLKKKRIILTNQSKNLKITLNLIEKILKNYKKNMKKSLINTKKILKTIQF